MFALFIGSLILLTYSGRIVSEQEDRRTRFCFGQEPTGDAKATNAGEGGVRNGH